MLLPHEGFRRASKKGGVVIVGLYNQYGGLSRTVRRRLLRIAAGSNVEKQMALAAKIFSLPTDMKMPVGVYLNDLYGHPVESKHSYGEVLTWFEKQNIQYIGSAPSLGLGTFWNVTLQQLMTSTNLRMQRIYKLLPKVVFNEKVEGPPSLLTRSVMQLLMLMTGQEMFNVAGIKR